MLPEFIKYISDNQLFDSSQKTLLAVSGGMDSTVMAHLFFAAGFRFGIAHCNFQLRGADSDGDEDFVRETAKSFNVPFYTKKFDTEAFAEKHKIGIQEAARELRYRWFETLLADEKYDFLATAHHKDDHIETFFINLLRGCGISGLHGILSKRGNIVRPLLFATREEIEKYAKTHRLSHREDVSNQTTKYTRNKIRHLLAPVLKEINPDYQNIINDDIARLQEAEKIYQARIRQLTDEIVSETKNGVLALDIQKLSQTEAPQTVLFEILAPYGFKKEAVSDIVNSLGGQSGKQFFSKEYVVLKDRRKLLLDKIQSAQEEEFTIAENDYEILRPLHLTFEIVDNSAFFSVPRSKNVVCFDRDKLVFPLTLRKARQGDKFIPFGMKKSKKLSDFFIDEKLSRIEKEQIWLLCAGEEIIWVVNRRRSALYPVDDKTKSIIVFRG